MTSSIFSHTSASYADYIFSHLGRGRRHARLLYQEWFRSGKVTGSDPAFRNAQALFQEICALTDFSFLPILKKGREGETEKYLLQTHDRMEIEMVLLPMKAGWTLCMSTQVGCKMGCAFCETGRMGLLRNLTTVEILSQLFQAKHGLGKPIRNIVFMGMGEPLDNYDHLIQSIRILTDVLAFGLGPSRLTISTSGIVDKIYQLAEEIDPAINLAISVNAPDDEIRRKLMPVNHRFDMTALRKAMEVYCQHPRRKILIEYVMIQGMTDRPGDAEKLAKYVEGLPVTINLIPYNPQSRAQFLPSLPEDIDTFRKQLIELGHRVFVRGTKGQKIMAACGQLGNRQLRKRMFGSIVS